MKRAVIFLALLLSGCKEQLYTKLTEREANEIAAVLIQNGIDVDRKSVKDGSITVSVEKDQLSQSIWILKNQGLPRQTFSSMADVFKGEGLIPSPMEERVRFLYALSEGLSRTISEIDGVIDARVHVVLPKNDPMNQEAQPSSASVFIRHFEDQPPRIPQIKMLVANSVDSLSYDKVSVVAFAVKRQTYQPIAASALFASPTMQPALLPIAGFALLGIALLTFLWKRRQNIIPKLGAPDLVDVTPNVKSTSSLSGDP
jgi:type III secretion protein J